MISDVLVFLRDRLNTYLSAGSSPDDLAESKVVFVDGEKMDPITFDLGAISVLLINVEEENTLRPPDLYMRVTPDGTRQKVQPEVRLNLYVLFVARFKQYEESLRQLSMVIRYFQNHRLLNQQNAPELAEDIEQLSVELVTMPFSEQNEVWNSLRTTYHPSVLYRVRMVVFQDEDAAEIPELEERVLKASP